MRRLAWILGSLSIVLFPCGVRSGFGDEPPQAPTGPFGYGLLENGEGGKADAEFFLSNETCSTCHERQFQEFQGSMHTAAHHDPLYRHFAERAREEAGEQVYAEQGIQCQDCHMSSVEDAVKVAETLKPIVRKGQSATDGPIREIYPHFFVGANVDADRLANGPQHARMAEARLKSAAKIEVRAPNKYAPGQPLEFEVSVHNVAAGHHIPTGVTELRRMWIDVRITDEHGTTLYRSGALDERGEFGPDTVWFGALAADVSGKATYKPWEMRSFLRKRTVPPKGVEREKFVARLSADAAGRLTIEAKLLYRSAPPHIVAEIMKEDAYPPKVTEMAVARVIVDH